MSDERITDALDGLPDASDPTAALLRDVLTREADAVRPAPDGLARIRAAIEAEAPRRSGLRALTGLTGGRAGRPGRAGGSRRPGERRWMPVLAAAASVVLLAGIGGFAVNRWPAFSEKADPAATPPVVLPKQLPVYVVGQVTGTDGRVEYALFREYKPTTARNLDERLSEAITEAVQSRPDDPDYTRVFGGGGSTPVQARWDPAAGVVDIALSTAAVTVRNASDARAQIAVQQLVWTASAVLSDSRPGSADVPVKIGIAGPTASPYMFGRTTYRLGGTFVRAHRVDDPSAPVWLVDPKDGDTLGRESDPAQKGFGVSVGYTGRAGVPWTLTRDGKEVVRGTAKPGFAAGADKAVPGSRGTAWIKVDHSLPGEYVLTVSEPATEPAPRWTDSKTFVVN